MDLSLENLAHLTQIMQVVCPPVGHEIGRLINLQNNMDTLVKEAALLKRKREDIEADDEEASRKRLMLTNHDGSWLREVQNSIFEFDSIKSEFDNSEAMSSWSCTKYWSRYRLGRRINKMLKSVKDLNERGVFQAISLPRVLEMPICRTMPGQSILKQTTHKIWAHLHDEHSQIIVVRGIAGVGKTTLMKIINNRLIGRRDFDIVIWITVSKAFNLQKIQKKIMERLDMSFEESDDEERRRSQVLDALKSTRFLLILDELWQAIDLDQIGIPKPTMQNRSKIAIATESPEVQNDMEADVVIRVNTLKEVEAWNLFLDNVGKVALQPDIQQLAKEVVMECNGLPLGIVTVGRAMKGKKEIVLWQNALRTLKESAPEIGGMESRVFPALKLSYDHLNDEKTKDCFLYCSLYPEDDEIDIDGLVKLWVAEGLIDGDLAAASLKGYGILDRIMDACLLEGGRKGDKHFVKMHHLVRNMALEITSSTSNGGPQFMVRSGVGVREPPRAEMWRENVRISLMRIEITSIPFKPDCRDLVSLFLSGNHILTTIHSNFFEGVFQAISLPRVLEMPICRTMPGQSILKQTTHKIWAHLHDEHSQIIGVLGMGGVGKTALKRIIDSQIIGVLGMGGVGKTALKRIIYYRLIGRRDFDIVIWITVSKAFNLQKIRKKLMERLDLRFEESDDEERRRYQVLDALKSTRFLLILDELWQAIDLDQIGIPKPTMQNRSKIAIATQSLEVQNDMEADVVIRVNTLKEVEAWNLFLDNVGKVALQPDIQQLAKEVVMECNGLPLGIVTVGRAMKGKKEIVLWQNALRTLKESAPEIGGMESRVFPALKLSYDHLNDEKTKDCFLYCSLYPEDDEIDIDGLVKLWVAEGLIDGDLAAASLKGYGILDRIMDACLLEGGRKGDKHFVKMHHLVRNMALEITSSTSNGGPQFMVRSGVGVREPPRAEMWRENVRISLMRIEITSIPFKPDCLDLVSLFLSGNHCLTTIHSNFFEGMPNLSALDLSSTAIKFLPASIGSLLKLRFLSVSNCMQLREVPYLAETKALRFLDLSHSGVRTLPQGIKNLKQLMALNLSHMKFLSMIPDNVITSLPHLEELCLFGTSINWAETSITPSEVATLKSLRTLTLSIVGRVPRDVYHQQWSTLNKFKISIGPNSSSEISLPCAKQVHISGSGRCVDGVKAPLTHAEGVFLNGTDIKCFSHLVGHSKSLKTIRIEDCNKMESVINWRNVEDGALQNIEELRLYEMPALKKLFEGEVPQYLRKLTKIVVHQCNRLKYLFSEMVQYLDYLELLYVTDCEDLEEIIGGDESLPDNPLPRLYSLILFKLGKLRSIIPCSSVSLPSLREFFIDSCPTLILPDRPGITKIQESAHGSQMVPMPLHRYR